MRIVDEKKPQPYVLSEPKKIQARNINTGQINNFATIAQASRFVEQYPGWRAEYTPERKAQEAKPREYVLILTESELTRLREGDAAARNDLSVAVRDWTAGKAANTHVVEVKARAMQGLDLLKFL